ncbi:MAG TPA: DUF2892 domain-containing protein [Syntrophomonadaceae bacterium]|nr:DUF2892 domain-containing protein [Syntrophomonadaceae bacterium]
MKCNVGKTEQMIRIGIGVVMIGIGIYFRSWWGLIGILPIITGTIRYCPASAILGVSTCEVKNK